MLSSEQRAQILEGLPPIKAASDQLTMLLRELMAGGMDEVDAMVWMYGRLCQTNEGRPDPADAMTKTAAFLFVQLAKQSATA